MSYSVVQERHLRRYLSIRTYLFLLTESYHIWGHSPRNPPPATSQTPSLSLPMWAEAHSPRFLPRISTMPRYICSNHRSENPVEATRRWSVYIFPDMHVYMCFDCEQVLSNVQISSNHTRIAGLEALSLGKIYFFKLHSYSVEGVLQRIHRIYLLHEGDWTHPVKPCTQARDQST